MNEGRVYNDAQEYARAVSNSQRTRIRDWSQYLLYDANNAGRWNDSVRYIALASVAKLGSFVPAAGQFEERRSDRTSVDNFPALNEEAIAATLSALQAHLDKKPRPLDNDPDLAARLRLDPTNKNAFTALSFGALYAKALDILQKESEGIDYSITEGDWEEISQGAPSSILTSLVRGYNTSWCIADDATAQDYLSRGTMYVYRTPREEGKEPAVSRIGIHVIDGQVREIRGIGKRQNLEGRLGDVLEAFKQAHPEISGWEQYQERIDDSRKLASVEIKMKEKPPVELSREELLFLYELKADKGGKLHLRPIQSFGYERDERIEDLQEKRKDRREEDMCTVFDCKSEQIARKKADLKKPGIVAYVGRLSNDFFKELPAHINHVYERFPQSSIAFRDITIGGKTPDQLRTEITGTLVAGIEMQISGCADDILGKIPEDKIAREGTKEELVIISVEQLGFPNGATTREIHEKAQKLGLELCSAEVGPHLRLQYKDQPMDEWLVVGMEPITDRGGDLLVFGVAHSEDGLWLHDVHGRPDRQWNSDRRFVFVRRT